MYLRYNHATMDLVHAKATADINKLHRNVVRQASLGPVLWLLHSIFSALFELEQRKDLDQCMLREILFNIHNVRCTLTKVTNFGREDQPLLAMIRQVLNLLDRGFSQQYVYS